MNFSTIKTKKIKKIKKPLFFQKFLKFWQRKKGQIFVWAAPKLGPSYFVRALVKWSILISDPWVSAQLSICANNCHQYMLILAHAHLGHYFPKVWTRSNNHEMKNSLVFHISYPLNNARLKIISTLKTNKAIFIRQNYQKIICLYTIYYSIEKYVLLGWSWRG